MEGKDGVDPPARKRKNRWDSGDDNKPDQERPEGAMVSESTFALSNEDVARKARKSRWGSVVENPPMPPVLLGGNQLSDEAVQQTLILKLQLQQVNQRLITVVQDALRIEQDPNRSPSPPPRYDSSGKRTNTREVRMKEALTQERVAIIEELLKLNPSYVPPADFVKAKPTKRIYIPKVADPLCNYIGLIIGPRGQTQKQMELDTGTKISIRGKGSAKDPNKGRIVDEDEDLHVHIQGETDEHVEKAAKLIEAILRPKDELALQEHKQKQLRQLALINGTLQEDEYCPVCGEKGHRQFECPYRAKAFKSAGVKCSICGDLSHPTRDCPLKEEGGANPANLDNEYDSFLAELGDGPKPSASNSASSSPRAASDAVTVNKTAAKSGTTVLQPIVDMLARKPQTIIKVSTVMTGAVPPPHISTIVPLAPPEPPMTSVSLLSMTANHSTANAPAIPNLHVPAASLPPVMYSAPGNMMPTMSMPSSVPPAPMPTVPSNYSSYIYPQYYPAHVAETPAFPNGGVPLPPPPMQLPPPPPPPPPL